MRTNISNPGHGGRAGAVRRPFGSLVVLLAIFSTTALRPAPVAAQATFAAATQLEAGAAATSDVSVDASGTFTGFRIGVYVDVADAPEAATELLAAGAVRTAGRYVGTRYRWGGGSPAEGFDCSGFVRFVFGQHGVEMPRISREQARMGRAMPTSLDGLEPGDLLFFAQRSSSIDHVAIYAGEGRIVHASRSGYGVRYDELTGDRGRWYAQRLVAVRRVLDGTVPAESAVPLDEEPEAFEEEAGDGAAPPPTHTR